MPIRMRPSVMGETSGTSSKCWNCKALGGWGLSYKGQHWSTQGKNRGNSSNQRPGIPWN